MVLSGQLALPQGHLLGDWYGLRTWLGGHGVTPGVTFVTDALGNPTGGVRQGFRGASNQGVDLRFDLPGVVPVTYEAVNQLLIDGDPLGLPAAS